MVKITLEFEGVEQAIVALGKLGGIPAAAGEKPARKGRDDKGQPRGQYKPRAQDGTAAGQSATISPKIASDGVTGVTDPSSGALVPASKSTVPDVPTGGTPTATVTAPAAVPSSNPADVVKAEIKQQQKTQGTGFPEPTVGEKDADVQKATEAVFGKFGIDRVKTLLADFGISRLRDLPKSKKADFLAATQKIVA
jgi:hypothetical protein